MIGFRKALGLLKSGFYFIEGAYADGLKLARNPVEGARAVYGVSVYQNAVYLMINSGLILSRALSSKAS